MSFNVNEMRSQLVFGGARNTLFNVTIQNPVNGVADIKVPFMCKAASLPESSIGVIPVPYFGRTIKIAGDRQYGEWGVTIINDEDFLIRNAMEQWVNAINTPEGNLRNLGTSSPLLYKAQAQVTQFSKTGVPLRIVQFNGIFPTSISPIDMAWEAQDQIEEFQVSFQYDWWEVVGGITGNAGGN